MPPLLSETSDGTALTIEQAADLMAVSPFTVRRMIARGDLRAVRFGRSIRIWPGELKRACRPVTSVGLGD